MAIGGWDYIRKQNNRITGSMPVKTKLLGAVYCLNFNLLTNKFRIASIATRKYSPLSEHF